MTSAARLLRTSWCAVALLALFGAPAARSQPPGEESPPAAPALPKWAAQINWRELAQPLEEAAVKGGQLMRAAPRGLERELARLGLAPFGGPARVNVRNAEQVEQQIKAMVPQYREQYRHVLYSELEATRQICTIPQANRREVYDAAEKAYDAAIEQYVRNMYFPVAGVQRGSRIRASIREGVAGLLKQHLPADEFAQLETVIRERAALRKQVSVEALVVRLDRLVYLSDEQREQITQSLLENWNDSWESWLMLWQYEEMYMPVVEDSLITGRLTPQQRQLWSTTQRISFGGELHSEFTQQFDAEFWGVKDPNAPANDVELIDRLAK